MFEKAERPFDAERDQRANINTAAGAMTGCDKPVREPTAREIIETALREVHEHIEGLNDLLGALPAKLPWRADRTLARLIASAIRPR